MKTTVCILFLLGYTYAMRSTIDWSKVKRVSNIVEPLPGVKLADVNGRVIGGRNATPHSIPYQVAVLVGNSNSLCGGSLISPEWVLTAAHCTIGVTSAQVILGAHNISLVEPTQVVIDSKNITNHPDYDQLTLNDISLIKLSSKVNLTDAIQVIELAADDSESFAGATALLSGWGMTSDEVFEASEILQEVNLTVISNAECQRTFGNVVQPSTICTSGAGGIGACTGDSGGPLVVGNVQVGVVSFGGGSCEKGLPSGYARVSSLIAWIKSVTGI